MTRQRQMPAAEDTGLGSCSHTLQKTRDKSNNNKKAKAVKTKTKPPPARKAFLQISKLAN
jgi:hypothetical protein